MTVLSHLTPTQLWIYFEEICKIPRISGNELKIRKYLLEFAKTNNLEFNEDEVGNILIIKPPSAGMEKRKTVVLQCHLDMVGEKNAGNPHNWETDPVVPLVRDGWVTATETTLGADDGIGIAAQMAVLKDKSIAAGRIECLFTVDEETGMTGAVNLKPDFFSGRTLLNLDSEDEGILFIGCAGGIGTAGTMKYKPVPVKKSRSALKITLTGLHGGHSGDEIHKGYGNSIKIMNRILLKISDEYDISVADFDGGNLGNAIPREAFATIVLDNSVIVNVKNLINDFYTELIKEFGDLEKEMKISYADVSLPLSEMDRKSRNKFLELLTCCPHGALAWSKDMDDLVETSTNLATVKFTENNTITILTTQRSSIESSKHEAAAMVAKCLRQAGAEVIHSDGYPGWKPDLTSEILDITRRSYHKLFGKEPEVKAIHAGLECGLFYEKFKGIDMISFGPTIRGAHTPEEMIETGTVQMFWDLLLEVLKNMPIKL